MNRERPQAVIVLGIANIVFGALGLLCGACGVSSYAVTMAVAKIPVQGGVANPAQATVQCLEREVPHGLAIEMSRAVLVLVLSAVLLIAGIGLLHMQGWARWLSLGYAVLAILLNIGWAFFEMVVMMPAVQRCQAMLGQQPGGGGAAQQSAHAVGAAAGVIGAASLTIIYALILAVLLLLPNVSEAFSASPRRRKRRRRREEEYDDEDEYDDRRDDDDE
jgi:hypothetical protein